MGSGTDLEHFDSVDNTSGYTAKTNAIFFSVSLEASERVNLFVDGTYAVSEGGFDPFELPEPEEQPAIWDNDFSSVNEYSDLEYKQLEATVGAKVAVSDRSQLYGSVTLMDLADEQPYVYGDLSGQLVYYSAGMTVRY